MSFWLLLWFALSFVLLYFFGWTMYILVRQKRSWKDFARKHNLRYKSGKFMDAPEVNGVFKGYSINMFTGEHIQNDSRGNRKLTALEIEINSRMPMDAVIGSGGMVDVARAFGLSDEFQPDIKGWKTEYIIRSDNYNMIKAYLGEDRLKQIMALMKAHNIWVILVFKGDDALLRVDLPDPLEDQKRLEAIMSKMVDVAKALELKDGEVRTLEKAGQVPRPVLEPSETEKKSAVVEELSLELEEEITQEELPEEDKKTD
jgi:hypothetical protein